MPTAERERARQARRERVAGIIVLLLLLPAFIAAGRLGLDRVATLAVMLGGIVLSLGLARRRTPGAGRLYLPLGLALLLLGGAREGLLRYAPATCRAAYREAADATARARVLAREPFPAPLRWLIWMGRPSICADFIGE